MSNDKPESEVQSRTCKNSGAAPCYAALPWLSLVDNPIPENLLGRKILAWHPRKSVGGLEQGFAGLRLGRAIRKHEVSHWLPAVGPDGFFEKQPIA